MARANTYHKLGKNRKCRCGKVFYVPLWRLKRGSKELFCSIFCKAESQREPMRGNKRGFGNRPVWNKGMKGLHLNPKTEFKKGMCPWNKDRAGWTIGTKAGFQKGNKLGWKGGLSFLPYSFDFNEELKMLIRRRDNFTCQVCGAPAVIVHHIDYNKKNSSQENLITMCVSCHSKTNNNRENWIEFFRVRLLH